MKRIVWTVRVERSFLAFAWVADPRRCVIVINGGYRVRTRWPDDGLTSPFPLLTLSIPFTPCCTAPTPPTRHSKALPPIGAFDARRGPKRGPHVPNRWTWAQINALRLSEFRNPQHTCITSYENAANTSFLLRAIPFMERGGLI
jgi:hypothetical protein